MIKIVFKGKKNKRFIKYCLIAMDRTLSQNSVNSKEIECDIV